MADVPKEKVTLKPRGKPCTCDNCLGSSCACRVDSGEQLGELWYCQKRATEQQESVLSQPFLQVRELNSAGFLQRTTGEPAYPVVMDPHRGGDGSVLPYSLLYILPSALNATFYAGGLHGVLTL